MTQSDDVSTLYAGSFNDFVARRDAMAKARRAAGDRTSADYIKAIRKPSRIAWAMNRAASSEEFEELVSTARSILAAQSNGRDVREAMAALRAAVRNFAAHASNTGAAEGINLDNNDVVNATFAILADSAAFEQLAHGILSDIPEAGGLDFLSTMTAAPTLTVSSGSDHAGGKKRDTQADSAENRRKEAALALARAEAQLEEVRKATEPALRALNVAETELGKAEYRLEQAVKAVDVARDVRDRAREKAAEASQRVSEAQTTLDDLRKLGK